MYIICRRAELLYAALGSSGLPWAVGCSGLLWTALRCSGQPMYSLHSQKDLKCIYHTSDNTDDVLHRIYYIVSFCAYLSMYIYIILKSIYVLDLPIYLVYTDIYIYIYIPCIYVYLYIY